MPGQSGTNLIKPGNNWINHGKRSDHSLQARKVTAKHAKRVAMRKMSPLMVAMLLGFGATALVAAEQPATGPSGFSAATESADSKGKTGESAGRPIKKRSAASPSAFRTIRPSPSLRSATNHPRSPRIYATPAL